VTELTWIMDPATGALVVEGLTMEEASALAGELLPAAWELNCARPPASSPLPAGHDTPGPTLRVARIYHGSVVDGPGRRSVVQVQGCPIRCPGCYVPETHDPRGGVVLSITSIVAAVLDPGGIPRDGVTVLGGEPFFQLAGLLALLRSLRQHRVHITVYSGYPLRLLRRRSEPEVAAALELIDLLIDGPFVAALADGAGEWRGSRNQRVIPNPATAPVWARIDHDAVAKRTRPGCVSRSTECQPTHVQE
jgi:anaerobic ribonucleoside-triphosphate reductase activating protein